MSLFAITSLLCSCFCLMLAVFALVSGKEKPYRLLLGFNLAVMIWGLGCFLAGLAKTPSESIFACKIADTGGFFVAALFYHLICSLYNVESKILLKIGYLQGVLFNLLNWATDWVMNDTRYAFGIYFIKVTPLLGTAIFFSCFHGGGSFFCPP